MTTSAQETDRIENERGKILTTPHLTNQNHANPQEYNQIRHQSQVRTDRVLTPDQCSLGPMTSSPMSRRAGGRGEKGGRRAE